MLAHYSKYWKKISVDIQLRNEGLLQGTLLRLASKEIATAYNNIEFYAIDTGYILYVNYNMILQP